MKVQTAERLRNNVLPLHNRTSCYMASRSYVKPDDLPGIAASLLLDSGNELELRPGGDVLDSGV